MRIQKTKITATVDSEKAIVRFLPTAIRDMADAQKVLDEIEDVAYNCKIEMLVVNFSRLKQMTSAFLSKLITLNKSLAQAGIKLRLCRMTPEVEEAFRICKLQKVIPLFATEEEALRK